MANTPHIIPVQPSGKYKRIDVPVGERRTLAEQMFGYRMEPVEEETQSVLGKIFYDRPVVSKPLTPKDKG